MFGYIRTSLMKNALNAGKVFHAFYARYPQILSVRLLDGELEEYRRINHPIDVGSPGPETKAELISLLRTLPADSILLLTMGHGTTENRVQVITDLINDTDRAMNAELTSGRYANLIPNEPSLEIKGTKAYNTFIKPHGMGVGIVMVEQDADTPRVRVVAGSKLARLRISTANTQAATNAYLILENDHGEVACMYYRALPSALSEAVINGTVAQYIGNYVEFAFRTINRWSPKEFNGIKVTHEITCCKINAVTDVCNGDLLRMK